MGRDGSIMTVGEVARMLGLANRTVTKLADRGELRAWTVPGSSHRRFARAEIEALRDRLGIPASVGAGGEAGAR